MCAKCFAATKVAEQVLESLNAEKCHAERVRDTYRRQGADAERERIIKLLEEYEVIGKDPKTNFMLNEDALIALIKGEN